MKNICEFTIWASSYGDEASSFFYIKLCFCSESYFVKGHYEAHWCEINVNLVRGSEMSFNDFFLFFKALAVCLFVLLLYVPSQQLWSWREGQFT